MRKMKMITGALACGALLLTACHSKDPNYNTSHPDKAQVTITTDWNGMGAGITKPTIYMAVINGTEYKGIPTTPESYTFPQVEPGSYTAYLYNEVIQMPVSGTAATVKTVAPPAGMTGTYIEPLPDWFFAGKLQEAVEKDTDYELIVPMRQQVRELTFIIEPTGGSANKITSITASLSGVAGTWNIDTDQPQGEAVNVALTFARITTGENSGKWSATVRLPGVTGAEQQLTGAINFTGNTLADIPLESVLTTELANFNTDKITPLILGGTIIETPTGAGFTATIKNWKKNKGSGTAN